MNCEECKEILVGYIEGLSAETQKRAVESHLEACPPCRAELTQLAGLHDRLVSNGKTLTRSNLEDKVLNRIMREQSLSLRKAKRFDRQFQLWRKIMKNRITKFATAAAIIVIAAVSIAFLSELTTPAYGLEETFEALAQVRTVHAFCTDWDGTKVETWVQINPETGWEDGIYSYTLQTGDVLVSTWDKTYYYDAKDNLVRVDKGLAPASEVRAGHFIEDVVDYISKQENGEIQILNEYDPKTRKNIIVLHGVSETDEFEAQIDPESKLPVSMNIIRGRGGMKSIDRIYYDQPLPAGIFEFEIPEDAEIVIHRAQSDNVLDDPDLGMVFEGLSDEEVCKTIIEEYWQAVIDQDWQKAQQLRPMPDKAWQRLKAYYADCRPVKLVEVNAPHYEQDCWIGPITPYVLETANGQLQTGDMIVKFRQTPGQESCVIAGPWGRELHPRK